MVFSAPALSGLWAPAAAPPSAPERIYALIDHAGAQGLLAELSGRRTLPWRSLFEGSREEGALDVAPILVDLGPAGEASAATQALLRWLESRCAHSHAVLCLRSAHPPEAVAKALSVRLDAELPDRMSVLLRYFDTRVWASLLAVLTPAQRGEFVGIASAWAWLDRAGQWQGLETVPQASAMPGTPLSLSPEQEAALIDAAHPDALLALMKPSAPDLCAAVPPADLHALVARQMPPIRRYRIEDARQQALFCITSLAEGEDFHTRPVWAQALEQAALAGPVDFLQIVQAVERS